MAWLLFDPASDLLLSPPPHPTMMAQAVTMALARPNNRHERDEEEGNTGNMAKPQLTTGRFQFAFCPLGQGMLICLKRKRMKRMDQIAADPEESFTDGKIRATAPAPVPHP